MNALKQLKLQSRDIVNKSTIPLAILFSFGFLFFACNEMQNPVSEVSEAESYAGPTASVTGVNEDPVVINNFEIKFNGNNYDSESNTSTFSYTVTRGDDGTGFNHMIFEVPSCAELNNYSPSESGSLTDDGIEWTSSIGANSSRDYEITYHGEVLTGMVDATIQASGNGDVETKEIPGPCKGIHTISGYVYVDENGNGTKDAGEGGIGNIKIQLLDDNSDEFTDPVTTPSNGSYAFSVFTGSTSTDFSIDVPEESNGLLFNNDNFSSTTNLPLPITVNNEDVANQNVGFKPDTQKIIDEFEAGLEIKLKTEKPKFWADEFKFSEKGKKTVFSKDDLLEFLDTIDNLEDLTYSFNFGATDDDRISNAEKILKVKGNSSDLDILLSEYLAALLNVVSGNGAFDENGNVLEDFNSLILKIGAAAAVAESGNNTSLMMNSTTYETKPYTGTASLSSSGELLTSFNGSGGGVGD